LIFNPISVNACTKASVSLVPTWPPSRLSIFNPSIQSEKREEFSAIWSARLPSRVERREKDSGDGPGEEFEGSGEERVPGGRIAERVVISVIRDTSTGLGRG
jgi:hypothetical protein